MKKTEAEEQDTFDTIVEAIDELETDPERHLSIQIDETLKDAIRAAQTSNKPAAVTIQVKVTPGAERRIGFTATVAAKLPKPPLSGVQMYADANGAVHRSDPAQRRLDFTHPAPTTPNKLKEN